MKETCLFVCLFVVCETVCDGVLSSVWSFTFDLYFHQGLNIHAFLLLHVISFLSLNDSFLIAGYIDR